MIDMDYDENIWDEVAVKEMCKIRRPKKSTTIDK